MVQTTNSAPDLVGATGGTGDWLDLRSPDSPFETSDPRNFDTDGRLLRELRDLLVTRPSEAELINAVKRAREGGWSWTPIAIVLGSSRNDAIRRFSRGIGHPCSRRRTRSAAPAPR